MDTQRIFASAIWFRAQAGEPVRTVVQESAHAVIVAWHLDPGQEIPAHIHPHGQDSWTVIAGTGLYRLDAAGTTQRIAAGDVVVAPLGAVHGVCNDGTAALRIISVVSPGTAGYQRL